jgi:hypothetical protein
MIYALKMVANVDVGDGLIFYNVKAGNSSRFEILKMEITIKS